MRWEGAEGEEGTMGMEEGLGAIASKRLLRKSTDKGVESDWLEPIHHPMLVQAQ